MGSRRRHLEQLIAREASVALAKLQAEQPVAQQAPVLTAEEAAEAKAAAEAAAAATEAAAAKAKAEAQAGGEGSGGKEGGGLAAAPAVANGSPPEPGHADARKPVLAPAPAPAPAPALGFELPTGARATEGRRRWSRVRGFVLRAALLPSPRQSPRGEAPGGRGDGEEKKKKKKRGSKAKRDASGGSTPTRD